MRVLDLFRIFLVRFGFQRAPAPVSIVAAIMCVPAEHVPHFRPSQERPAPEHACGQQPGPRAARLVQLFFGKDGQVGEETLQAGDTLPGGADMPPLSAESASLRGEAIVRAEGNGPAAQDVRYRVNPFLQYSPADRGMPDVESKVNGISHKMSYRVGHSAYPTLINLRIVP